MEDGLVSAKTFSLPFDDNLRLDRVRNVTSRVRLMMKRVDLFGDRPLVAGEYHARTQRNLGHPFAPVARLAHAADGTVFIGRDCEALFRGKAQKEEHMAARKGRHERLFRIDTGRVGERRPHHMRRGGSVHMRATIELPFVCAAIAAVNEALV